MRPVNTHCLGNIGGGPKVNINMETRIWWYFLYSNKLNQTGCFIYKNIIYIFPCIINEIDLLDL